MQSSIKAKSMYINIPIYGAGSRSIKQSIINTTFNRIEKTNNSYTINALSNINLNIRSGDRVGIYGKNGSGKTTLLRAIVGAYEPTSGSISVNGTVGSMLSIGLGMDPEFTGRENIYIRCTLMGLKKRTIDKLIEEIIFFSELGDFIDMPMRIYSSGMSMRLSFSIATAINPDIVIMDEWMSVGDHDFVVKSEKRLMNFIDSAQILMLASHDAALLTRTCNKIIRLENGFLINEYSSSEFNNYLQN